MNDEHYFYYSFFMGAMLGAMLLLLIVVVGVWREKKPQGYGGSPGHMSPMEVEALYEKNKP